jgi:hypothetical protein
MNAVELINRAKEAGVVLSTDGHRLKYEGPDAAVDELIGDLRQHKAELIAELEASDPVEAVATMASDTCRTCRAYDNGRCYKFVFLAGRSGTPERTTADRIACGDYQRARRYRAGAAGFGLEGGAIQ